MQLAVKLIEPEPVGDRGVNFQGFARDPLARLRPDRRERSHVVQPVGELDQDDAHVARHRQQHLAEILRLRVGLRLELDLVELGKTIHQLRHRLAEALGDLLLGDRRVLHHVVKEGGHDRLDVELPVGDDLGDGERMRDVRVAAQPELPLVSGVAELVGLFDSTDVARLQVAEVLPEVGEGDRRHGLAFAPVTGRGVLRPPLARGHGLYPVCTRLRYSAPTLPAAISRRAITVGLSRVVSIRGVPPWASCLAR